MGKFIITSGAIVINKQNMILLKLHPVRGWELPGGIVEENETVQNAVIREVKEETGIDIDIIGFCGVSQEISNNICNMWWQGTPVTEKLQTSIESLEVGFFPIEEALKIINNKNYQEELLICLEKEKHPFFIAFN